MAVTLAAGMGATSWVAAKLGITAVTPPKSFYSVTFERLEAPPPPAPPPAPAAGGATEDERDAVPEEDPPEPEAAPTEVVKLDLQARPRPRTTSIPGDATGKGGPLGSPLGIPGGAGPHCPLPPCVGTQADFGRTTIPRPEPTRAAPIQAPIRTVMASAVFTPDPDQATLGRTPTGRSHRSPGKATISFCIDGRGKTYDVRVRRGFRGDAEVDEICRKTVARWRFSPQRVAGKARSTCSSVTFDIRFD